MNCSKRPAFSSTGLARRLRKFKSSCLGGLIVMHLGSKSSQPVLTWPATQQFVTLCMAQSLYCAIGHTVLQHCLASCWPTSGGNKAIAPYALRYICLKQDGFGNPSGDATASIRDTKFPSPKNNDQDKIDRDGEVNAPQHPCRSGSSRRCRQGRNNPWDSWRDIAGW